MACDLEWALSIGEGLGDVPPERQGSGRTPGDRVQDPAQQLQSTSWKDGPRPSASTGRGRGGREQPATWEEAIWLGYRCVRLGVDGPRWLCLPQVQIWLKKEGDAQWELGQVQDALMASKANEQKLNDKVRHETWITWSKRE